MRKTLLIIEPIHETGLALARDDLEVRVIEDASPAALIGAIRDAHAITVRSARVTRDPVGAARRLKVVSRHGVGWDNAFDGKLDPAVVVNPETLTKPRRTVHA